MKQKMILSWVFLLLAGWIQAQQKFELTVKEAVDLAYKNVVELKNAQIDYQIQVAKNREIVGQAFPQLAGSVSTNYYFKVPTILFPDATATAVYSILKEEGVNGNSGPITKVPNPTLREVSFLQPYNLVAGATLTQLLFQPDVFVGLQARQTALDYSQALVEQTKEKIKDSAYKRYYAILIAEKQLHFIDESLKRLQKLYHDDSIMYKNGFAEKLDLDKVQVQINNLSTSRNAVANAVEVGYAALKFAIGISQNDVVTLRDDLSTASLKDQILNDAFIYEDRAEIKTLNQLQKLQELDMKRHKLGFIPTVAATANYNYNGIGPKFFTSNQTFWFQGAYVGLNINIPIFDGFQRKYRVEQSRLNVEKLQNTVGNVKQAIDFEQKATSSSLKTALNNLDVQERNMQLAERVYSATKLKFEQGLGSSFEVLQADADFQQAQGTYFNAMYNAIVAKISYQSSLGKLP